MNSLLKKILENEELMIKNYSDNKFMVNNFPTHIIIEPTNLCNIECIQCRTSSIIKRLKEEGFLFGYLSDVIFEKILDFIPYACSIHLSGWGEPYLHPNFDEFLIRIRKLNPYAHIKFNTNGTLLNEDRISTLIKSPVNLISISVDSSNKQNFQMIRKGADFDLVYKNINQLISAKVKNNSKYPKIMIAFVVMRENISDLPDMVKFSKECGADMLHCINVENKLDDPERPTPLIERDYLNNKDYFLETIMLGEKFDIPVIGPGIDNFKKIYYNNGPNCLPKNDNSSCMEPYRTIFINCQGYIAPCCFVPYKNMGKLPEDSINNIWNNKKYNALRRSLLRSPIEYCKKCIENGHNVDLKKYHIYRDKIGNI